MIRADGSPSRTAPRAPGSALASRPGSARSRWRLTVVALALGALTGSALASAQPSEEPLGVIKGDQHIVRTQIELGLGHLYGAVAALEAAGTAEELAAVSTASYQAYRYFRFANAGLDLLIARRFKNPLHQLVHDAVWQARLLIISARLALDGAIQYPQERAARVAEALAQLRQALAHVEQARLLL